MEMYPQMAATAKAEGLEDVLPPLPPSLAAASWIHKSPRISSLTHLHVTKVSSWFETLATAEATHLKIVQRVQQEMDDLDASP